MKLYRPLFTGIILVNVAMSPVWADEPAENTNQQKTPEESPWDGSASLSYIIENGNSTSRSLYGEGELSYQWDKWFIGAKANGGSDKSKDSSTGDLERTSEKYYAELREERNFNKKDYLFHLTTFKNDNFSSYAYQASDSLGYGRRLITTEIHNLSAEIAPGYRQRKLRDPNPGTSRTERDAIIHVGLNYSWQITENTEFKEDIQSDIAKSNDYNLRFKTDITTMLSEHFAFSIGHLLTRDAQVEDGDHKTDSQLTISLTYKMK